MMKDDNRKEMKGNIVAIIFGLLLLSFFGIRSMRHAIAPMVRVENNCETIVQARVVRSEMEERTKPPWTTLQPGGIHDGGTVSGIYLYKYIIEFRSEKARWVKEIDKSSKIDNDYLVKAKPDSTPH